MWLFRKRQEEEEEYEDDDDDEYDEEDDEDEAYSDEDEDDDGDAHQTDRMVGVAEGVEPKTPSYHSRTKGSTGTAHSSEQTSGEDSGAPYEITANTSSAKSTDQESNKDGESPTTVVADNESPDTTSANVKENGDDKETDDDDDDDDFPEEITGRVSEEEEEAMSAEEKQSLLALATEHDRVDIIKSILTEQEADRDKLLHSGIPPLHTAVSFGSTNATQCLLRMGADPSIRPNVAELKEQGLAKSANVNRYDGVSAWELAFGREAGGNVADAATLSTAEAKRKYGPVKPVNMAPSKREGIRHAFTAEALRCIGADEAIRLEQLLKSGMPADTDIGGKHLYDWAVEMGAVGCQKVLRPLEDESQKSDNGNESAGQTAGEQRSAVLDRTTTPGEETVSQLVNRLVELDSLARALSSCLDNLAEEVSVCHGLLMMGGGASALAAHVRSLKDLQARQSEELDRCLLEWEECEDELAYWLKEAGNRCDDIKTMISPVDELTTRKELYPTPSGPEEEEAQRRQLLAQIAASEHKVRKLRASISDLSEENTRDLKEVEKRGLTGGIKLVRGLREKLREIEFHQSEAKNGIASCRAKVGLIHSRLQTLKHNEKSATGGTNREPVFSHKESKEESSPVNGDSSPALGEPTEIDSIDQTTESGEVEVPKKAEEGAGKDSSFVAKIAKGQSEAIAVRTADGRGFFPADLWEIFLRIIGLSRAAAHNSAESFRQSTSNVMIV